MRYFLVSCGISVLTNGLKGALEAKEICKYSNMSEEEIFEKAPEFYEKFNDEYKKLVASLKSRSNEWLKTFSAELNSLLNYGISDKDHYKLLVTDTFLGIKAAEVIKAVLEGKGLSVYLDKRKDLHTGSVEEFELAIAELARDLANELIDWKKKGYSIIFNLTGGFKGINSFLQVMASLYADESIYIFEKSNELLKIPKLPIKIDESIFKNKLDVFRKLWLGMDVSGDEISSIPNSLVLIKISGEYSLSAWGELVWEKFKDDFYRQNLIPSLSDRIEFSGEFKKNFKDLNPVEKKALNEKIDMLERYILNGENPSSLRYHRLKGNIAQRYSHEFYPFEGNDSRRVYCNERDGKIILECIAAHLK